MQIRTAIKDFSRLKIYLSGTSQTNGWERKVPIVSSRENPKCGTIQQCSTWRVGHQECYGAHFRGLFEWGKEIPSNENRGPTCWNTRRKEEETLWPTTLDSTCVPSLGASLRLAGDTMAFQFGGPSCCKVVPLLIVSQQVPAVSMDFETERETLLNFDQTPPPPKGAGRQLDIHHSRRKNKTMNFNGVICLFRRRRDNPLFREGKVTKGQLFWMRGETNRIGIRTGYGPGEGKNLKTSNLFFFPLKNIYRKYTHIHVCVFHLKKKGGDDVDRTDWPPLTKSRSTRPLSAFFLRQIHFLKCWNAAEQRLLKKLNFDPSDTFQLIW